MSYPELEYRALEIYCLNPCFNGICSMRVVCLDSCGNVLGCLNPCFNGICSMSAFAEGTLCFEGGLNPCFNGICSMRRQPP